MADQKKDLTGLMDYAKAMEDAGQGMPVPEGSGMEEQKLEKIDDFVSLDEYGKSNPAPEIEPYSEAPALDTSASDFPTTPEPEDPFATTVPTDEAPAMEGMTGLDFSTQSEPEAAPELSAESSSEPTFEAQPEPIASLEIEPEPAPEPAPIAVPVPEEAAPPIQEVLRPALKAPAPASSPAPASTLEKVKQYSEQIQPGKASVPAAFPFSLLITGKLAPEEKERLLDILSRENMGIREIDLETQFECGKILIPRISEYAGVLIVGALRSTSARMRLGPSDTIFATPDTQDEESEHFDSGEPNSNSSSGDTSLPGHPAEHIPLTPESAIPNLPQFIVIDVVTASAALKSNLVETESSPEYQELLEALQRELKYKAFRKGATAVLNFSVQLTNTGLPTSYRILVMGSAVKAPSAN